MAPTVLPDNADGSAATVLRGHGKASTHGGSRGGTPSQISLPQAVAGSVDAAVLAEEVSRIERAAEQRGYEAGHARAEAELRAAVEGASGLAERLEAVAPERTSEIAHSIAELALSVAKRIIQHEVRVDPSLLCSSLEAAVSTINGSPEAHVLLNPSAVEPVATAWEALHGRAYLGKKWLFEGDPTLPIGGCTLRYEHGFVEAGLEAQLEEVGIALDRAIPNLARGTVEEGVA
jgi:flagellar assembly protein FliH